MVFKRRKWLLEELYSRLIVPKANEKTKVEAMRTITSSEANFETLIVISIHENFSLHCRDSIRVSKL